MECPHLVSRWVWDEYVCWNCGRSLTFPPRPAAPDEKKGHQAGPMKRRPKPEPVAIMAGTLSCLTCHHEHLPHQVDVAGRVMCASCRSPLALQCACCLETLTDCAFYKNPAQVRRGGFMNRCRPCTSNRNRAMREANPEGHRARSRDYSRRIQAERLAGERLPVHESLTTIQKHHHRQATIRSRARRDGEFVPKLRPGRGNIYLKPVCRISESCPLRAFLHRWLMVTLLRRMNGV